MKLENGGKPGLIDALANKWKTASGGRKVLWWAVALLATYLVYCFKKSSDEIRSQRRK